MADRAGDDKLQAYPAGWQMREPFAFQPQICIPLFILCSDPASNIALRTEGSGKGL